MADERSSILTQAAVEAAELIDQVIQEMNADPVFGIPFGQEKAGTRGMREMIRRAAVGDEQAMVAVAQLAVDQGHTQDGDDCPVCQHVAEVMKQWQP